jgi:hypothetical protein
MIDLDALPTGQAVTAAVGRLLRMPRGEPLELQSGTALCHLGICPAEPGRSRLAAW